MFEYVRWCNSVEDLASGKCSRVRFRTRRYSAKILSKIACFLLVRGRELITTVFFKVSPRLYNEIKDCALLSTLTEGVYEHGGEKMKGCE